MPHAKYLSCSWRFCATLLCLLTASVGCRDEPDTKVSVGVVAPLSGSGASYGQSVRRGVETALSTGGENSFEATFEDSRIEPDTGRSAYEKLVTVDRAVAVIGPFGSSVVLAVAPAANRFKVPIISASATADDIASAGDFVFRITPPNSKQGATLASFAAAELDALTAATLYQRNDYGETLSEGFSSAFERLGGELLVTESAAGGASDFRSQLTKIRQAEPDVLFLPLHHRETALAMKQARELGIEASFLTADGAMTPELLELAGKAAEGSFFSTLGLGADDEPRRLYSEFRAAYVERYGEEPGVYEAYYYDVTKLLLRVLAPGMSGEAVRDALYAISQDSAYSGVSGSIAFDENGEVDRPFGVYTVTEGQYVPLDQ